MIEKILNFFKYLALHQRLSVLVFTISITTAAMALSSGLAMNFQWSIMLPKSIPAVDEYFRVIKDYPLGTNYVITAKSNNPSDTEDALEEIIKAVESLEDVVITTYGKLPEDFIIKHGLYLLSPAELINFSEALADPGLIPYLNNLNNLFENPPESPEEDRIDERSIVRNIQAFEGLLRIIDRASVSGHVTNKELSRVVRDLTTGNPFQLSYDKKMGIIPVAVTCDIFDYDEIINADSIIIQKLDTIKKNFPSVTIGTTGTIPLSRDEMESIGFYTIGLFAAAFMMILILLIWNYRCLWTPLMALLPVVLGIICSMGFYAVTIRELNIFTATIMLVLIGLGIDFSVHMISRFFEVRDQGRSLEDALHASVVLTGKSIFSGALTTSMAFMALMVGDTKGIVEFGFCASTGILITLVVIFIFLPTLLVWRENRLTKKNVQTLSRNFTFLGGVSEKIFQRRYLSVMLLFIIIAGAFLFQEKKLEYEYDMLNLEPKGLESIELQEELVKRFNMSAEIAFLTAESIDELRVLEKQLKEKEVVSEVDSILKLIPKQELMDENEIIIGILRDAMKIQIPEGVSNPENPAETGTRLSAELKRLYNNITLIEEMMGENEHLHAALKRLTGGNVQESLLMKLAQRFEDGAVNWQEVEKVSGRFISLMSQRVSLMIESSQPVSEKTLPKKLLNLYKSEKTGRYLLQIYPKKFLFNYQPLIEFNESMDDISPAVTGMPKLMILINEGMIKDGKWAMVLAFFVIILLLFFHFRSIPSIILAIIPLLFGTVWMLALMSLYGIKLNLVNIVALPCIIGIAIDNNIHLLHRWREEGVGGVKVAVSRVGNAISMTTLTTMIGFGSVYFYTHRGIASLGQVLFIGVGCCFISTIIVLPSIGAFFEKQIMK